VITFVVRCRLQDGKQEEAERLINELVTSVEEQEPGAIGYAFHRNVRDLKELLLVESYACNEAFLVHNMSPHMLRFRARFTELFDPPTAQVDLLEEVAGFARPWQDGQAAQPSDVAHVLSGTG
jgi:quinol monooxygenase YgiN